MAAHAQQAENRNTGPYINKTNCPKRATARPTKTTDPTRNEKEIHKVLSMNKKVICENQSLVK